MPYEQLKFLKKSSETKKLEKLFRNIVAGGRPKL